MHKCDALSQYLSGATLTWCQNDVSTAKLASWMLASLSVPGQKRKHAISKRCEVICTASVTQKFYQIGYCKSWYVYSIALFLCNSPTMCILHTISTSTHAKFWLAPSSRPIVELLEFLWLGGHMQGLLPVRCWIPWKRTIHRVACGYMKLLAEPSSEHAWSDGKWDAFPSLATMWQTW